MKFSKENRRAGTGKTTLAELVAKYLGKFSKENRRTTTLVVGGAGPGFQLRNSLKRIEGSMNKAYISNVSVQPVMKFSKENRRSPSLCSQPPCRIRT